MLFFLHELFFYAEHRRRGYATTRHHDDSNIINAAEEAVSNDIIDAPEEGNILSGINQTNRLVTDALINRPKQIPACESHNDRVQSVSTPDCQVTRENISADTSLTPTSDTNVTPLRVEPVHHKLVFMAGGHEMNLLRSSEQDPVPVLPRQSRRRGGDSSYSTGSSDDNDEYNMIPTHNMIRSGTSSSDQACNSPGKVNTAPGINPRSSRPTVTPRGVRARNKTTPPGHGVCAGRATALHACLQRLSLSPGGASSVNVPVSQQACSSSQFRDVDSDTSTGDMTVSDCTPDTKSGSGQVHIPGRTGLGRSATLARHVT